MLMQSSSVPSSLCHSYTLRVTVARCTGSGLSLGIQFLPYAGLVSCQTRQVSPLARSAAPRALWLAYAVIGILMDDGTLVDNGAEQAGVLAVLGTMLSLRVIAQAKPALSQVSPSTLTGPRCRRRRHTRAAG